MQFSAEPVAVQSFVQEVLLLAEFGPAWVAVGSRIAHILGAILFLGMAFYVGGVLGPALRTLPDEEAAKVRAATRQPWALLVMASSAVLLVTGFFNYFRVISLNSDGTYDLPALYHPLIGVKMLLAFGLFFLVSLLAGRSAAAQKMQQKMSMWMNLVILLGVVLVAIAGVLKMLPKTPEVAPPAAAAEEDPSPATPSGDQPAEPEGDAAPGEPSDG